MSASSRPLVAILDYGIGNLRSAERALLRAGADARLTADHALIDEADAVVLPGVGAFGACMRALRTSGLDDAARRGVASGRPFLGICVGMQMLFTRSEESPDATGLDIVPGTVQWLPDTVKRPQMQWNALRRQADDPLFEGLGDDPWFYFVHSLHAVPDDASTVVATCDYGTTVTAAVRAGNVFATQFHPEKSAAAGLGLLANFVRVCASVTR